MDKNNYSCLYCGSKEFIEHSNFKGSTSRYAEGSFTYARCSGCKSFNNLGSHEIDYSDYINGDSVSEIKVNRFISFIKKLNFDGEILDYGCGNGALVKALNKKGFHVDGYEPYNKAFKNISEKKYSLVYSTHVFEHISDYSEFFKKLNNFTKVRSLVISIHPSASRIKKLNNKCKFQNYTLHAPFHLGVPSDEATIKLFKKNGFKLIRKIGYDIQRSGFKDNSRVSALLTNVTGGIKENAVNIGIFKKVKAFMKAPFGFFNTMFLNTKDRYVSTFVFEKIINN
jgi:hypothetical protein